MLRPSFFVKYYINATPLVLVSKLNNIYWIEPWAFLLLSVFLGHPIQRGQHAVNTRKVIEDKAKALTDPPKILFDYDYHDNCEAFANLLNGAADLQEGKIQGVQCYHVHRGVVAFCSIINCLKSCRQRKSLREAITKRWEDCGLRSWFSKWSKNSV